MAREGRKFREVDIAIVSAQLSKDRFPPRHPEDAPQGVDFRMNLTGLSTHQNLYFVAFSSEIHVYKPSFPSQTFGPRLYRWTPLTTGIHGISTVANPHCINQLLISEFGDEEVISTSHDNGDFLVCTVRSLCRAISAVQRGEVKEDEAAEKYLRYVHRSNVGYSAWGIATHKNARLLAVSANSWVVTVYAPALIPGRQSDEGPDRTHDQERTLREGHGNNIPAITFCNTEADLYGRYLVSTDLNGAIVIWDIWKRCSIVKILMNFRGLNRPSRSFHGWSVTCIEPQSLQQVSSDLELVGYERHRSIEDGPYQSHGPADVSNGRSYLRDHDVDWHFAGNARDTLRHDGAQASRVGHAGRNPFPFGRTLAPTNNDSPGQERFIRERFTFGGDNDDDDDDGSGGEDDSLFVDEDDGVFDALANELGRDDESGSNGDGDGDGDGDGNESEGESLREEELEELGLRYNEQGELEDDDSESEPLRDDELESLGLLYNELGELVEADPDDSPEAYYERLREEAVRLAVQRFVARRGAIEEHESESEDVSDADIDDENLDEGWPQNDYDMTDFGPPVPSEGRLGPESQPSAVQTQSLAGSQHSLTPNPPEPSRNPEIGSTYTPGSWTAASHQVLNNPVTTPRPQDSENPTPTPPARSDFSELALATTESPHPATNNPTAPAHSLETGTTYTPGSWRAASRRRDHSPPDDIVAEAEAEERERLRLIMLANPPPWETGELAREPESEPSRSWFYEAARPLRIPAPRGITHNSLAHDRYRRAISDRNRANQLAHEIVQRAPGPGPSSTTPPVPAAAGGAQDRTCAPPNSPAVPPEPSIPFHILHTGGDIVSLLRAPFRQASAICIDPCHQHMPFRLAHLAQHDRLALTAYIPDISVMVTGSLAGRAAVFTLCERKGATKDGGDDAAIRLDWVVPFRSQEVQMHRPACALIGVAAAPVQGLVEEVGMLPRGKGKGKERERVGRWRLVLTYQDSTVLTYELWREMGEKGRGGLAVEELVI